MTNLGITAQTLAEFTGRRLLTITEKEMRELTPEKVKPIYKRKYWDACKCDQLPAGLDIQVFDFAVNSGPTRAIKELQQCLRVADDGILGAVTLKHISTFPLELIIKEYAEARRDFLKNIKTFPKFGKGWISRVDKVEKSAITFA
jgi:lysozyme family protein